MKVIDLIDFLQKCDKTLEIRVWNDGYPVVKIAREAEITDFLVDAHTNDESPKKKYVLIS